MTAKNQLEKEREYHQGRNAFIGDALEEALNKMYGMIGDYPATDEFMTDPYLAIIQPDEDVALLAAKIYAAAQSLKEISHEITFDGVGYEVQILPF